MIAGAVVAVLVFAGCATRDIDDRSAVIVSDGVEDEVRAALAELGDAVGRQDLDRITALFADDYASIEATGKDAVREWWVRVIDIGLAAEFDLDLTTAELVIAGDVAEVTYYDEHGEMACSNVAEPCTTPQPYLSFRLERDEQLGWLIVGIPSQDLEASRP